MTTNLNTQRIVDTLRQPPCNWQIVSDNYRPKAMGMSRERKATCDMTAKRAIMQCIFAPNLPEHIAVRNMNYLLAFVAAAGAPDAIDWTLGRTKQAVHADTYRSAIVCNALHIMLRVDKQRSLTTITIRPCKARVYER